MRDVELFVRCIAFRDSLSTYTGNLKTFLDDECGRLNSKWTTDEADIRQKVAEMESAIAASFDIFGDNAFRKYDGKSYETRFNRAVFDIMVYYFANDAVRKAALAKKSKVRSAYEALSTDAAFVRSVETTTKSLDATRRRFSMWGNALGKAVGVKVTIPSIGKP
jgi:hypothetical protein